MGAKVQKDYETAQGLTHIKRIIVIKCVSVDFAVVANLLYGDFIHGNTLGKFDKTVHYGFFRKI